MQKDGSEDIKDNLNSTDIAVGVGAGVELFDKFDVGLRYNFGVTDVNKDGDSFKNNVLQFGISYKF
jgi:outer membrane immunogenic protein